MTTDDTYCLTDTMPARTGPVVKTADIAGALRAVRLATPAHDPERSRIALTRYIGVCKDVCRQSSKSVLVEAISVLMVHAASMPRGCSLSDTDPGWPEFVVSRLSSMGFGGPVPRCQFGVSHPPDHLWYCYSSGGVIMSLDYFLRRQDRVAFAPIGGSASDTYERCRCGTWYRPLVVL